METLAGTPLAYLLTFRTYGTWLHGDERGSVDRQHNVPGTPMLDASPGWESVSKSRMAAAPVTLSPEARIRVEQVIADICSHRGWELYAVNARSNHVHVVVSSPQTPESTMTTIKRWVTRRLSESGDVSPGAPVWSRHGSTRYLWRERDVERAGTYVREAQDNDRFE